MAFDPDKYLASKQANSEFNPDAYLASKMTKELPSELESLARGAAQGATLGFAPQISGAAQAAVGGNLTDPEQLLELYRKYRDASKGEFKQAEEANPKSYMAGNVVGGLASSALLPEMSAIKAGALLGGAAGLASSEADLTKGEILPALRDTATGAAFGGATGGVVGKLMGALGSAPEALETAAAKRAVAATGPTKGQVKDLIKTDRLVEQGKNLLKKSEFQEKPIVTPFASPDVMLERVESLEKTSGETIGNVLKEIDTKYSIDNPDIKSKFVNPSNIAKKIEELQNKFTENGEIVPLYESEYNKLQKAIDTVNKFGNEPIDFTKAARLKQLISQSSYGETGKLEDQLMGQVRSVVNNEIEQSADAVTKATNSSDLLNKYVQAKDMYRTAKDAKNALVGKTASEVTNRDFGITDYMAGIGAAALHGTPTGMAAAGINKLAKTYGNSIAATGYKKTADVLRSVNKAFTSAPEALKSVGESLVQSDDALKTQLGRMLVEASEKDEIGRNAIIFSLMQNSKYRELMKDISSKKE